MYIYNLYIYATIHLLCRLERKIRTHLDLLSISQLGGKKFKTSRWDQRLQIQNPSMAFKRVPRWK